MIQNLTTGALRKEKRIWKQKNFLERQNFPIIFVEKLHLKIFRTNSKPNEHSWDADGFGDKHTLEPVCQVMRAAVKLSQGAKTNQKICSTPKEYLDQTTYIQPSVNWKPLDFFSRKFNGRDDTQFACTRQPDLKSCRQRKETKEVDKS